MFSPSHFLSRLVAVLLVLVLVPSLATTHAFSIQTKAYPSQRSSSKFSLSAQRPSKSALNYADAEDDFEDFVIHYELEKESKPSPETIFPLPAQHRNVDLHGLEELAPLERHMLRMEGLDPYVLVSVLTSTASYNTICGIDLFQNGHLDLMSGFLLASSTISAVSGIYSTTVFSMSVLYGKTALGLDKEDLYYTFMESTRNNRIRGYKAFSTTLLLFLVNIFLIAIDKLPEPAQGPAAIIALATTFFGANEFISITSAASPMFQDLIPKDRR